MHLDFGGALENVEDAGPQRSTALSAAIIVRRCQPDGALRRRFCGRTDCWPLPGRLGGGDDRGAGKITLNLPDRLAHFLEKPSRVGKMVRSAKPLGHPAARFCPAEQGGAHPMGCVDRLRRPNRQRQTNIAPGPHNEGWSMVSFTHLVGPGMGHSRRRLLSLGYLRTAFIRSVLAARR